MRQRVDVLGVEFDRLDLPSAADVILERVDRGERTFVITANPEFIMLARHDRELAEIARRADIVVADGTGVMVGSRLLGDGLPRVAGRMLVDRLMPELSHRGARIFLLGAGIGVAERAAYALRRRWPSLQIVGTYAGSADVESAERVRAAEPSVVLVAYGMPKQERWIAHHLASLPSVHLAIGVGGVLDQLAGVQRVPPAFLHRVGLEWLWRLANEPSRWRRQRVLPQFAGLVLRKRILGR